MADVPYSYEGLDPKYIELAKKELNEDPKKIRAHIASLRNWLSQCKHIKNCPTDDAFLLRFLRVAKFDHEKAQARLENYCTLRGSELRGCPSFFKFPSLDDPTLNKVLDLGAFIPAGYNKRGELVMVGNMRGWDPSDIPYVNLLPSVYMGMEVLLADERVQIAGLTGVFDMGDMNKKQFDSMMGSQKEMKNEMKIWQDGCPMRNRDIYYYREPLIFDMLFSIMKFWLKEKLLKRIHRVKNDLKKIHNQMPGAKEILPEEYGGTNGTLQDMKQRWKKRFFDYWTQPDKLKELVIDESLRPKDSLKFLKDYADLPDDLIGTRGTYTKIEAD